LGHILGWKHWFFHGKTHVGIICLEFKRHKFKRSVTIFSTHLSSSKKSIWVIRIQFPLSLIINKNIIFLAFYKRQVIKDLPFLCYNAIFSRCFCGKNYFFKNGAYKRDSKGEFWTINWSFWWDFLDCLSLFSADYRTITKVKLIKI